jgi:hypothetical protein
VKELSKLHRMYITIKVNYTSLPFQQLVEHQRLLEVMQLGAT